MKKVLHEPNLDLIDIKIIAWLLSMVLIGLVLGIMLTNYDSEKGLRTSRSLKVRARTSCVRGARKKGKEAA